MIQDPKKKSEWTPLVEIDGCPITSANIHSLGIPDLVFEAPVATKGQEGRRCTSLSPLTIRAHGVPGVRTEIEGWFRAAAGGRAASKDLSLSFFHREGGHRSYRFLEAFPVRWSTGEYSPSSTTKVETIVVKIGLVEFA